MHTHKYAPGSRSAALNCGTVLALFIWQRYLGEHVVVVVVNFISNSTSFAWQ